MIKLTVDQPIDAILKLKARKTMRGDIVVLDHPEIDVVVSPHENRVVTYSKKEYGDHIYAVQSRLFDFLVRKGSILNGSVRSSNVFGSMQGFLLSDKEKAKAIDPHQVALYLVAKFIKEELGEGDVIDDYQDAYDELLTDPPDEDSTPLGRIPHQAEKGTDYFGSGNYLGVYGYYG
tara:strand:- start:820 stop:1347 length:528 start_codon:yes stop_codon:yes gene_type:complete